MLAGTGLIFIAMIIASVLSDYVKTQNLFESMKNGMPKLAPTVVVFLTCLFTSMGFTVVRTGQCVSRVRERMFTNLVEQDIQYFDEMTTGVLISRLAEDAAFAINTYVEKFMNAFQYCSQISAAVIMAMATCWRVTLAVVGIIPISIALYYVAEYIVERRSKKFKDTSSVSTEKADAVMSSFRTVKSCDGEMYEARQYGDSLQAIHDVVEGVSQTHAIKTGLLSFLSWGIIAPIIYYASWLLVKCPWVHIEVGDLVILVNSFANVGVAVPMIINAIDDFSTAAFSAAKVLSILEANPPRRRTEGSSLENPRGQIEFRDVCFKYPDTLAYAVNHLSFTVNTGETVALVGESGCGKTTTLALLQQLYPIESGAILIDGVDTATLAPTSVRAAMSIVPQMPVLFSMSVLDNIRYARPNAEEGEVTQAAQIGNAHDFVMEIPSNYHASVEQTSLSGGQKQRLCIARAILADAPILLLDEATAALDTESERLVQQSLEQCRSGKTTIVVAHRLTTVRNADRILVFEHGAVTETGTHEELLARNGVYANLVKFQLQ
jgi:ABC-type multidrug transport system fused ATPase/permease subunit